ncbi:putative glycosyl hydrolase [Coniochaeta sp. PMI_546]|nr:putative glycosyl hydrolase [Coniochaeta sp. PMI_546]
MLPQVLMGTSTLASAILPNYTTSESGNPFIAGWYADPDADFFDSRYWVYPTSSLPYDEQTYLDAFSSPDLVHWTRYPSILTTANVSWANRAVWAPCVVQRHGKYYLYFGANDIQLGDGQVGGIGVAVSDYPQGPFVDALGKPLIGEYHYGAQPIDQDVFVDDDGQAYIYYGGHSHAVMAKLNEDMVSLGTFSYDNGSSETFRDITPPGYVEGAVVFKRQEQYYMMWSEGGWGGPDYAVAYGTADTPLGPFNRVTKILEQDPAVATGSGHNGVLNVPGTDIWYIVYHRRPLSETDQNHRVVCYDRLYFDNSGGIQPVKMLVRDNFEDGQMIAWKTWTSDTRFEVKDGEMVNVVKEGGLYKVLGLALLDTNFTDFVYEADVTIFEDNEEGQGAGLVFRATKADDPGKPYFNGYYVGISASRKSVSVGETLEGAGLRSLGEAAADVETGKKYHLKIQVVGNEIKVYVDHSLLVTVRSTPDIKPAFKSGANGVRIDQARAAFDNISVEKA